MVILKTAEFWCGFGKNGWVITLGNLKANGCLPFVHKISSSCLQYTTPVFGIAGLQRIMLTNFSAEIPKQRAACLSTVGII